MNKPTLLTVPCLLATLLTPALSCGEDFLLYTPKPSEEKQAPASPNEGVLVRKITVKRGDTLADLSRKYIGRSSWFPQVLVFNNIKNPDLIYTGDKLLIPVPPEHAAASAEKAAPAKKHARGKKRHAARHAARHEEAGKPEAMQPEPAKPAVTKPGVARAGSAKAGVGKPGATKPGAAKSEAVKPRVPKQATVRPELPAPRPATAEESGSYRQAKLAYLNGEYQRSLMLFTEFLSKYPNSSFAPDAALYRADSMLHLSGE